VNAIVPTPRAPRRRFREHEAPRKANDAVALLWPAPQPGEHALIVDGWGAVHDSPEHDLVVFVQPGKAVLHVTAQPPPGAARLTAATGDPARDA
jgi:hypothetical protein